MRRLCPPDRLGTRARLFTMALWSILACAGPGSAAMTQERMEAILRERVDEARGGGGGLEFRYAGVAMLCISDPSHDRMRIIAPIRSEADVSDHQRRLALAANFHTALDARYASSEGVLYAAFIHPLSPLDEAQLLSALRQVASLALSFGTTYSSGELIFGGPRAPEPEPLRDPERPDSPEERAL